MDVTQLALTWVGWPNGGKLTSTWVQIWSRPKWTQVITSQRKCTQALAKRSRELTQVFNLRQLASPFGQGSRVLCWKHMTGDDDAVLGSVPFTGEKYSKPRPQNRILVPLWRSLTFPSSSPILFVRKSLLGIYVCHFSMKASTSVEIICWDISSHKKSYVSLEAFRTFSGRPTCKCSGGSMPANTLSHLFINYVYIYHCNSHSQLQVLRLFLYHFNNDSKFQKSTVYS